MYVDLDTVPVGGEGATTRIVWVRGDPDSIRLIKEAMALLRPQGVEIIIPEPGQELEADVVVEPAGSVPEARILHEASIRVRHVVSGEEDPRRALAIALSMPRGSFRELIIGVDPGASCGMSAIADALILWAGRVSCSMVGEKILWLKSWIPHDRISVFIGRGPGSAVAEHSVIEAGLEYRLVEEYGTTAQPILWDVLRVLGDRDLVASASIALLGAAVDRRESREVHKGA